MALTSCKKADALTTTSMILLPTTERINTRRAIGTAREDSRGETFKDLRISKLLPRHERALVG